MKLLIVLLSLLFLFSPGKLLAKENILLLKTWKGEDVSGWLMSEKLDGIRAIWDGRILCTRSGKGIAAPQWFVKKLPPFAIDGELWTRRGNFQNIQSIVMDHRPSEKWQEITYNIFDVPNARGGLQHRLIKLADWLQLHPTPCIHILEQIPCRNNAHLEAFRRDIEAKGGEGVVVRNPDAPYEKKRTANALKVKSFEDDECVVTAHHEGRGHFVGMLGAFSCRLPNGQVFRIGSGLKKSDRLNPPAIGTIVTFKHQGWTDGGKPRFPVFLRVNVIKQR
ncbi:DNA ligase [Desulforhopalus vacuolatus]|uniref:DNA ligase n=1 Tax=Desulforhopalus vacuolatus TaxID=40414 RepID=UPI0019664E84|nr:DNA ligase [Desulforhopalus vacuolatus]MBM9519774.1 DNA ligase [Desulforhopalus vacuolatus]